MYMPSCMGRWRQAWQVKVSGRNDAARMANSSAATSPPSFSAKDKAVRELDPALLPTAAAPPQADPPTALPACRSPLCSPPHSDERAAHLVEAEEVEEAEVVEPGVAPHDKPRWHR
eukprot:CAMPEP_0180480742 /NCGR_PEP_ID=MMETSP1036_2-20121128/33991_1 /TAXON_ID=632150 /ORGANISM="Azadinium spinosum, Strain 3D9" /LENGTH=115 /DNA_ID=CAMNT_0022488383 /DNA_START=178 /DNA_END=526 /DNA_ORIENTATION=-